MKGTTKKAARTKSVTKGNPAGLPDPAVDAVFDAYPKPLKAKLLALRRLIFDNRKDHQGRRRAAGNPEMGPAPAISHRRQKAAARSGSTQVNRLPTNTRLYFHCQTDLVETFRELYPRELSYGGNRSILLNAQDEMPEAALRHCVALALTYHLNKRKPARRA